MFNKDIKGKYPKVPFAKLEEYLSKYDNEYYSCLVAGDLTFGRNATNLLLKCLQSSRLILLGFFDCVNQVHIPISYLATRFHFEITASVAYFYHNLQKFYDGKITQQELNELLVKLTSGGRTFPPKERYKHRPDAVNILTMVETVDKLFTKSGEKNEKRFKDAYDYLSEFCHPNCMAQNIGVETQSKKGLVFYLKSPPFQNSDLQVLVYYMLISCVNFFYFYAQCFSLLKKNEKVPKLIK